MANSEVALKTVVVPKASLSKRKFGEHAGALTGGFARKVVRLFSIGEEKLLPLSNPQDRFTPAIDRGWLWETKVNIASTGGVFLIADVVGSSCALFIPGNDVALALPIVAAAQLLLLPLGVGFSKWQRGRKRNFNAFLPWLKGRYGISLNARQGLPGYLANTTAPWSREFKDDTGRTLVLAENPRDVYAVQLPNSDQELPHVGEIIGTRVKGKLSAKPVEVSLPKELKSLFFQIEEHLQVLAGRPLSPESDHVVARAARDRDAVMALVTDLIRLNVTRLDSTQEAAIKRNFTTLLSELQEVTRRETTFALEALNIENSYVAAREVKPGIRLQKELKR